MLTKILPKNARIAVAVSGGADSVVLLDRLAAVAEGLEFLGIEIDLDKNAEKNNGQIRDITAKNGKVKVLVIPTNEELVIARDTMKMAFGK